MGTGCSREVDPQKPTADRHAVVTLHVYDIGDGGGGSLLNRILKPLGTGAFHCGVEVHGREWSYSDINDATSSTMTGVFSCAPRRCLGHAYKQSIAMGKTSMSQREVIMLVKLMAREWLIGGYDLLRRNCCHFSNEFCIRMGVGTIPSWVTSLAGAGAAVVDGDFADATCCRMVAAQVTGGMCCLSDKADELDREAISVPRRQSTIHPVSVFSLDAAEEIDWPPQSRSRSVSPASKERYGAVLESLAYSSL